MIPFCPSVRLLTVSNDNSKAIDAICPSFGKNVALVGGFNPCPAEPGYTLPLQTV